MPTMEAHAPEKHTQNLKSGSKAALPKAEEIKNDQVQVEPETQKVQEEPKKQEEAK